MLKNIHQHKIYETLQQIHAFTFIDFYNNNAILAMDKYYFLYFMLIFKMNTINKQQQQLTKKN